MSTESADEVLRKAVELGCVMKAIVYCSGTCVNKLVLIFDKGA